MTAVDNASITGYLDLRTLIDVDPPRYDPVRDRDTVARPSQRSKQYRHSDRYRQSSQWNWKVGQYTALSLWESPTLVSPVISLSLPRSTTLSSRKRVIKWWNGRGLFINAAACIVTFSTDHCINYYNVYSVQHMFAIFIFLLPASKQRLASFSLVENVMFYKPFP